MVIELRMARTDLRERHRWPPRTHADFNPAAVAGWSAVELVTFEGHLLKGARWDPDLVVDSSGGLIEGRPSDPEAQARLEAVRFEIKRPPTLDRWRRIRT